MAEFITGEGHYQLLGSAHSLQFDRPSEVFAKHPDTTEEIRELCADVKVLGPRWVWSGSRLLWAAIAPYCILPSKCPWAFVINGPKMGVGGRLHAEAICMYNIHVRIHANHRII